MKNAFQEFKSANKEGQANCNIKDSEEILTEDFKKVFEHACNPWDVEG